MQELLGVKEHTDPCHGATTYLFQLRIHKECCLGGIRSSFVSAVKQNLRELGLLKVTLTRRDTLAIEAAEPSATVLAAWPDKFDFEERWRQSSAAPKWRQSRGTVDRIR